MNKDVLVKFKNSHFIVFKSNVFMDFLKTPDFKRMVFSYKYL